MNRTIKRLLILATATGLTITTLASASYYFGVRPLENELNTQQLAELNNNVQNLANRFKQTRSELEVALGDLEQSRNELAQANAVKETLENDLESLKHDKSRLETVLQTRTEQLKQLATTLRVEIGNKDYDTLYNEVLQRVQVLSESKNDLYEGLIRELESTLEDFVQRDINPIESNETLIEAVHAALSHAYQLGVDAAETAYEPVVGLLETVGLDVAWLYYGPEYRSITDPVIVFGQHYTAQPIGLNARVRDANGNVTTKRIEVPGFWGGPGQGNPMIWNGFGWAIFDMTNNRIYAETSEMVDGHPVATGMGWVNATDVFEVMKLSNGQEHTILWASANRQFAKAFVPVLPESSGSLTWDSQGALYTSNANGNPQYRLHNLPNPGRLSPEERGDDYELISAPSSRNFQDFLIQKQTPWVKQ